MFSEESAFRLPHSGGDADGTVLLFGEVLADIFPDRTVLGGAPFNVARHLKAFGQNPVLVTRMGSDTLCDEVLSVMSHHGMETLAVQFDSKHPTGRVNVHIGADGHRFEIIPMQAYDFIDASEARTNTLSLNPALVYFGTLAQRHDVSRQALETLLLGTDAARFLDINLRAPWYDEAMLARSLQYSNILKLNTDELDVLSETFGLRESDLQERARELMNRFDIEHVVVTCGEAGAWQMNRDGTVFEAGGKNRVGLLMDTVGAGDGFSAVCILGALLGWPAAKALGRANAFAAAICGIRGAVPQYVDFYQPFIEEWGI